MSGKEIKFVNDAFETNWIAPVGPHIDLFEKELSNIHHNRHVAALQSGTSAIHLALNLLGVNKDDIVLCQSFTFVGSVNPVRYLGAVPNFVDSEVELNILLKFKPGNVTKSPNFFEHLYLLS